MRTLIILAAAVLILALVGWITFSSDPDRSSINLETNEIKQDTQDVMESGAELLDEAEQAVDPDSAETAPTEPAPQEETPPTVEPYVVP